MRHRQDDWFGDGVAPVGGGPWVFAGGRPKPGDASDAIAWTSGDLVTWISTVLPVPVGPSYARVWALGHDAFGYVAGGTASGAGTGQTVTWLSDDGWTWRLADAQASEDLGIDAIATGPAGTLALGSVPVSLGSSAFNAWRLVREP